MSGDFWEGTVEGNIVAYELPREPHNTVAGHIGIIVGSQDPMNVDYLPGLDVIVGPASVYKCDVQGISHHRRLR